MNAEKPFVIGQQIFKMFDLFHRQISAVFVMNGSVRTFRLKIVNVVQIHKNNAVANENADFFDFFFD